MVMQVKDVMGLVAIAVRPEATFAELVATMQRFKVGAVAVIDERSRPIGVVSQDDLLLREVDAGGGMFAGRRQRREQGKAAGRTARELMTCPAVVVERETPVREAARLMHVHRVRQLPVVDATSGQIAGTVHQGDLLKVFGRPAGEVVAEMAGALARAGVDPGAVAVSVEDGVVRVVGRVPRRSQIAALVREGRRVDGVVDVEVEVEYDRDDGVMISPVHL